MVNDPLKKALEAHNALQRLQEPAQKALKLLEQDSAVRRLIEDTQRHEELMRAVLGPMEDLRRLQESAQAAVKLFEQGSAVRQLMDDARRHEHLMRAALGPMEELRQSGWLDRSSTLAAASIQATQLLNQIDGRFHLPEIAVAGRLFHDYQSSGIASIMERYQEQNAAIERAMASMRAPWLDTQDHLHSITGFVSLQGIGNALRTVHAFDERLTEALRVDLGDWQETICWPDNIFTDLGARTAFYLERGLNPALSAFPGDAFRQAVAIAGLDSAPPPLIGRYRAETAREIDEGEVGFDRTNAAHDRLMRFETRLRKFIDEQMTAAFGEKWVKQRVPEPIRKDWEQKKQNAKDAGEPERPLIAYADFSDYVPIITRNDNWEAVFKPLFRRQTFVQESFQRMYPIRICTMHARIITQDDELYLDVEIKRILTLIGVG